LHINNYMSTLLQQEHHTAMSLLFYTFVAVYTSWAVHTTPVWIYNPKGSRPVKLSMSAQCVCMKWGVILNSIDRGPYRWKRAMCPASGYIANWTSVPWHCWGGVYQLCACVLTSELCTRTIKGFISPNPFWFIKDFWRWNCWIFLEAIHTPPFVTCFDCCILVCVIPYSCLLFKMYSAYPDCGLFVFVYLLCSENHILKFLPVWPT